MVAKSLTKMAISPTAPVPVITRMWRAMEPVTKRGGGGATIGAGGNAETDMEASLGAPRALGNGQIVGPHRLGDGKGIGAQGRGGDVRSGEPQEGTRPC